MNKSLLIIGFLILSAFIKAQANFEINFQRNAIASIINPETDSLFSDKAEIKIFETGSALSVELKFYNLENNNYVLVHNSVNSLTSLPNSECPSDFCFFKLNNNLIYINLGMRNPISGKQKVFIKVNGKAGTQSISKEVEL